MVNYKPIFRIVILCSLVGVMDGTGYMTKLGAYGEKYIQKFKTPDFTEKDVDAFVEDYIRYKSVSCEKKLFLGYPKKKSKQESLNENKEASEGPYAAYAVSKAADIAYAISLSRAIKNRNITVNGVSLEKATNNSDFLVLSWLCGNRFEPT